MTTKHKLFLIHTRKFSQTLRLDRQPKKKYIKYTNIYEEHRNSDRSDYQRLLNQGRKLAPYDKRFPVTGKGTGPGVEGGTELALQLGSVHLVPPTGFINKRGQFKPVKKLQTEYVVPDLTNFHGTDITRKACECLKKQFGCLKKHPVGYAAWITYTKKTLKPCWLCKLKPYVPYDKVPDIEKGQHTAREIFDAFYSDNIKDEFYKKIEGGQPEKKTLLGRVKKS